MAPTSFVNFCASKWTRICLSSVRWPRSTVIPLPLVTDSPKMHTHTHTRTHSGREIHTHSERHAETDNRSHTLTDSQRHWKRDPQERTYSYSPTDRDSTKTEANTHIHKQTQTNTHTHIHTRTLTNTQSRTHWRKLGESHNQQRHKWAPTSGLSYLISHRLSRKLFDRFCNILFKKLNFDCCWRYGHKQ